MFIKSLTRLFKEKATGKDGFKFCKGDDVLAQFEHETVPVKIKLISEYGVIDIEGTGADGTKIMATTYEGDICNPETEEKTGEHIPDWVDSWEVS